MSEFPITIRTPVSKFAMELKFDSADPEIVEFAVYPTEAATEEQRDRGSVLWFGTFDTVCETIITEVLHAKSDD